MPPYSRSAAARLVSLLLHGAALLLVAQGVIVQPPAPPAEVAVAMQFAASPAPPHPPAAPSAVAIPSPAVPAVPAQTEQVQAVPAPATRTQATPAPAPTVPVMPQAAHLPAARVVAAAPRRPRPVAPPARLAAAPPEAAPAPVSRVLPPGPAPAGPVPAPDDGAALARLAENIHAAVRAAAVMPAAAARQHREGRAQVRFFYRDGVLADIELARSSQSRLLDDAALAAVRNASCPPPPALLRGRRLPMAVWIEFSIRGAALAG